MENRILLLEDDVSLIDGLQYSLKKNGFDVDFVRSVQETLTYLSEIEKYDMLILDVTLPDGTGFEICEKVRKNGSQIPIIFLTAKDEASDKLSGLGLGADDYITKPFSLRELNARIKAVFRRSKHIVENTEEVRTFGKLVINLDRREAFYDGKSIDLTPSEYAILVTLSENVGRPYSRLQLLTATLGESYAGYERAIDTHVSNLRKKIEPNPQKPIFIQTVYGLGYKFGDKYETVD